MVELYQIDKSNVSRHLRAIFAEGELEEKAVVAYFATTGLDGRNYQVGHYHLDAVIAVGYRVRSPRGTQFRQWATERLREYLVKGFTMDDERLKNPPGAGVPDHFDELLERIRDIRASERRVYLRVREISLGWKHVTGSLDTRPSLAALPRRLDSRALTMSRPRAP